LFKPEFFGRGALPVRKWKEVTTMSVDLRPGESQDSLLKRFRKAVAEARILPIVRQKRWFTSKSEIKRIKRQKAIRKSQRPPGAWVIGRGGAGWAKNA
jgi:small subunit ribosomal protein S21